MQTLHSTCPQHMNVLVLFTKIHSHCFYNQTASQWYPPNLKWAQCLPGCLSLVCSPAQFDCHFIFGLTVFSGTRIFYQSEVTVNDRQGALWFDFGFRESVSEYMTHSVIVSYSKYVDFWFYIYDVSIKVAESVQCVWDALKHESTFISWLSLHCP